MATPTQEARRHPLAALTRPHSAGLAPLVPVVLVAAFLLWIVVNFIDYPTASTNAILIGVTIGCLYALIALGYTLVYGILELINFAHGDVFMLGCMIAASIATTVFSLDGTQAASVTWPLLMVTLLITMAAGALINATIEIVAYRPLRSAPRLAPLITAIGVSFILEDIALAWKGPNFISVPNIFPQTRLFQYGDIEYRWDKLVVVFITIPVLLVLVYLVQYTKQGKAMRATAQDMDAAAMMGINVNRTVSFTFAIAGALAGAAGFLYALYVTNVRFDQGFQLGLIAFTAAVLGGIGNLPGAVLGSLLIGLIQSMNEGFLWHAPGSDWTQSIVFAILILILVFRPEGLLGERTPEGG